VRRLLVATRNPGKVRELHALLSDAGWEVVGLDALGIALTPEEEAVEEEAVEAFDSFEENALAKARFFAERTGMATLADDSGLAVDALGGAPGVRSRRFAAPDAARGERQDEANNRRLLELLADTPDAARTARFVCAAAFARPGGGSVVRSGALEGVIAREPRGGGGFGYDPVVFLPTEGCTVAELPPGRKNELSHRGRAVRALAAALEGVDESPHCA
jgi:XTP/dITP diphosphohydrolase